MTFTFTLTQPIQRISFVCDTPPLVENSTSKFFLYSWRDDLRWPIGWLQKSAGWKGNKKKNAIREKKQTTKGKQIKKKSFAEERSNASLLAVGPWWLNLSYWQQVPALVLFALDRFPKKRMFVNQQCIGSYQKTTGKTTVWGHVCPEVLKWSRDC